MRVKNLLVPLTTTVIILVFLVVTFSYFSHQRNMRKLHDQVTLNLKKTWAFSSTASGYYGHYCFMGEYGGRRILVCGDDEAKNIPRLLTRLADGQAVAVTGRLNTDATEIAVWEISFPHKIPEASE